MDVMSNASLKMETNIDAMNKAKETQQNTVSKLLDETMQQEKQLQQQQDQQTSKTVASSLGMGVNIDLRG